MFSVSGWKVCVWHPQQGHPKFSSLFASSKISENRAFGFPLFLKSGFFSTLEFFFTLVGRCVYGAHRGPCTVSTDGEGQRGQLA